MPCTDSPTCIGGPDASMATARHRQRHNHLSSCALTVRRRPLATVYYLPHATRHATYDAREDAFGTTYEHQRQQYDVAWWTAHVHTRGNLDALPWAHAFEIQARTPADLFDAMDRPAMARETDTFLPPSPPAAPPSASWLFFPEDRRYPYKLTCELPERWGLYGPSSSLQLSTRPGEFHVWQVGVYAHAAALRVLDCSLAHASYDGAASPSLAKDLSFRCFNLKGIDHRGQPLAKTVAVEQNCVRSLWFGVQVPLAVPDGAGGEREWRREGNATSDEMSLQLRLRLQSEGGAPQIETITVRFRVRGQPVYDYGDSQRWRLSRLRWLDSTLARGDAASRADQPRLPSPFVPLAHGREGSRGLSVRSLMARVLIGKDGLPAELSAGDGALHPLLRQPLAFDVDSGLENTSRVSWSHEEPAAFTHTGEDVVRWKASMTSSDRQLKLSVHGEYWFDGQALFHVDLKALRLTGVSDATLRLETAAARYMMGFGKAGRSLARNAPVHWGWREGEGNYLG